MKAGTTRQWISTMNSSPVPNSGLVQITHFTGDISWPHSSVAFRGAKADTKNAAGVSRSQR